MKLGTLLLLIFDTILIAFLPLEAYINFQNGNNSIAISDSVFAALVFIDMLVLLVTIHITDTKIRKNNNDANTRA